MATAPDPTNQLAVLLQHQNPALPHGCAADGLGQAAGTAPPACSVRHASPDPKRQSPAVPAGPTGTLPRPWKWSVADHAIPQPVPCACMAPVLQPGTACRQQPRALAGIRVTYRLGSERRHQAGARRCPRGWTLGLPAALQQMWGPGRCWRPLTRGTGRCPPS